MFFPSSHPAVPHLADVRRVLVFAGLYVRVARLIHGEGGEVGAELDVGRVVLTEAHPGAHPIAVELFRMCGLKRVSVVNLSPTLVSVQGWFDTLSGMTRDELERAHADSILECERHPEGSEARRAARAESDRYLSALLDAQEATSPNP